MYDDLGSDERGISEILGTVLLISMVLLGSATVIIFGASAISDATEDTRTEAATDYLEEVDSRLATLSASSDDPEVLFDPQDSAASDYRINRDGYLNVTVNDNSACSFQQPLSSIQFEDTNGNTVGYEAGGVFRSDVGGSVLVTPPDVVFSDGTVSVSLVNVTGTFDQARNRVRLNATKTRHSTEAFTSRLLRDKCARPDTVNVTVDSRFSGAWRDYLIEETGVPAANRSAPGARPVWVELNDTMLHPSVNDRENNVINLSEARNPGQPPYMDPGATLDDDAPPELGVDKSAGNTYTTYVGPLTNRSPQIGRRISVEGLNVTGPPLDVTLILDESGSMGGWATPSCTPADSDNEWTKMGAAICAAQDFVGDLNQSRDRVGIVSYNSQAYYRQVSQQYLSDDFAGTNETLDELDHGGNTRIDLGLDQSNSVFDLKGNDTRQKVAILLSDGENVCYAYGCNPDLWSIEAAQQADNNSITVYTIGFGSGADEDLLEDIALAADGAYYDANNASALEDAFKNISERIQPKDAVAHSPISSTVTDSGGTTFAPEIPGKTGHIANTSSGFLNINDPTAPTNYRHSFSLSDGETFEMNVTDYQCRDGHYNVTGQTVTAGGTTRSVARCTDFDSKNGTTYHGDIYVDGERPIPLLRTSYATWQTDVNQSLKQFPSVSINKTTGKLNTTSNQALVVYDLPPTGSGSQNTMALLVRIGLAESNSAGTGIVTVRVSEATVD